MRLFECPILYGVVELTDEREEHIASEHPDLLPERLDELTLTLAEPDDVLPGWSQESDFSSGGMLQSEVADMSLQS